MKTAWLVCVIALGGSALACNPFGPDQSTVLSTITIDAPTSVAAGATFTVTLTVQTGGCLTFDRIDVQPNATGATLVPWGKDASIGRTDITCTQENRLEQHAVQLNAGSSDPFYVDVDRGSLSPLRATVRVQ